MALPILPGIFLVLWGLAAFKKSDLVWKMEFCNIALIVSGPFLV